MATRQDAWWAGFNDAHDGFDYDNTYTALVTSAHQYQLGFEAGTPAPEDSNRAERIAARVAAYDRATERIARLGSWEADGMLRAICEAFPDGAPAMLRHAMGATYYPSGAPVKP